MSSIQNSAITQNINQIDALFAEFSTNLEKISQQKETHTIPNAKEIQNERTDIPQLPIPKSNLSLDTLVSALGFNERKVACKANLEHIETKAQQQKEINDKQLKDLQVQLDKLDEQKLINGFKKAFSIIGAILGAVSSALTLVLGALTANPVLVGAGVVGMTLAIDSTVSLTSDGKYSLAVGFAKLGEAMGLSKEDAQYFSLGLQLILSALNIALSAGAGLASNSSSIANAGGSIEKIAKLIGTTQKVTTISNALVSTSDGTTNIISSVIKYSLEHLKINNKEVEALLQRINEALQSEKDIIKTEIQRINFLYTQIMEIINQKNNAQQAILHGSPNFA